MISPIPLLIAGAITLLAAVLSAKAPAHGGPAPCLPVPGAVACGGRGTEALEVVADRGYFHGNEFLACAEAKITVTLPKRHDLRREG